VAAYDNMPRKGTAEADGRHFDLAYGDMLIGGFTCIYILTLNQLAFIQYSKIKKKKPLPLVVAFFGLEVFNYE